MRRIRGGESPISCPPLLDDALHLGTVREIALHLRCAAERERGTYAAVVLHLRQVLQPLPVPTLAGNGILAGRRAHEAPRLASQLPHEQRALPMESAGTLLRVAARLHDSSSLM